MIGKTTLLALTMSLFTCSTQINKDDFDKNACEKYRTEFLKRYKDFDVQNLEKNPVNFFQLYNKFCATLKLVKGKDYDIIQCYEVNENKGGLYYELLHFKSGVKLDTTANDIKQHYCIDAFNIKITRLYRIGSNTVICVNYYSQFDINKYNQILKKCFGDNISTITLDNPH